MQGGHPTFDLSSRPTDPTALRGDEALIKGDKAFAQHPYRPQRAEMGDGRLTTVDGLPQEV